MKYLQFTMAAGLLALAGAVAAEPVTPSGSATPVPEVGTASGALESLAEQNAGDLLKKTQLGNEEKPALNLEGGTYSVARVQVPDPVPLPGALWLFGSALLGFMGFSSKRKV